MFLILMVIGLAGLFVMALPALGGHGHAGGHGGHGHAGLLGRATGLRTGSRTEMLAAHHDASSETRSLLRFIPSPRAVASVLALYGAFGNALEHAAQLSFMMAAIVAVVPALLVEWVVIRPVWNLMFRFQGKPSTPLEQIVLGEATAVVPFRNGRGVVSLVRDGRIVQFSARLPDDQVSMPVNVGDRLRIEDVDAARERVTVTLVSQRNSLPR